MRVAREEGGGGRKVNGNPMRAAIWNKNLAMARLPSVWCTHPERRPVPWNANGEREVQNAWWSLAWRATW